MLSQVLETVFELHLDMLASLQQHLARRDVVRLREYRQSRYPAHHLAGERIEIRQRLNLVIEQLDAYGIAVRFGGEDVDDVSPYPISALRKIQLVAGVLQLGQPPQQRALIDAVAAKQMQHH